MPSKQSLPPLHLPLASSRRLLAAVLVPHILAAFVLLGLDLRSPIVLVGFGLLDLSVFILICTHYRRCAPWAVSALVWEGDGSWRIRMGSGEQVSGRLRPSSVVLPQLILLNLELDGGGRLSVPILSDTLPAELRRRLRVRLRTEGRGGDLNEP